MEAYECLSSQPQTWSVTQDVTHKKGILLENVNFVRSYQTSCPIAQ